MCFAYDALPPDLPADRMPAPIAGGAGAERVELTSRDGTRFAAAFAAAPEPRATAVAILPDVRGLYGFYVALAERFAQAGHHALAFDYFGRTAGVEERDGEFEYMPHVVQTTAEQVRADLTAAIEALRERTGAQRVAAVGFCFGGTHAYAAATDAALGLDRAVGFYGALSPRRPGMPDAKALAPQTRCPLLALFGEADASIPAADRELFAQGLRASGAPHEVIAYPGAPHSFFDRSAEQHAEASADAWRRTLDFLSAGEAG